MVFVFVRVMWCVCVFVTCLVCVVFHVFVCALMRCLCCVCVSVSCVVCVCVVCFVSRVCGFGVFRVWLVCRLRVCVRVVCVCRVCAQSGSNGVSMSSSRSICAYNIFWLKSSLLVRIPIAESHYQPSSTKSLRFMRPNV